MIWLWKHLGLSDTSSTLVKVLGNQSHSELYIACAINCPAHFISPEKAILALYTRTNQVGGPSNSWQNPEPLSTFASFNKHLIKKLPLRSTCVYCSWLTSEGDPQRASFIERMVFINGHKASFKYQWDLLFPLVVGLSVYC